uniref:Reverse transcriptase Ty1/copia-type domain-containing protein n=1 Tax=Chromera velia CCMP2878 TaxID=1169474 RepID=A0A0K6S6R2_9ALVE|eukprot:Cvel_462.t2-p1 / transcript=Cvel_462.t2 / gene=Cvel_462 / organism=Chromera_velia_CCMP2878 / gene_product=Putative transposon Ty5-1 protein YCL074W, putative / transcript_product=Putative transposon Ty5-1 protein YCL074W, putative / location=Cvel_scaffold14:224902-226733(+) / protein_length=485 / sequence_SO=supercontig / SO=protein_coding / is_pseudo=false
MGVISISIQVLVAFDACKRRGVDLSLQKADVVQAYLQAPLPPDRPPLAAIPPSNHPDHGQFLWVLRKAVYGLPDAGKVFEDFLTSVLRSLGWEPTLFPGVWVLHSANGKLRALLATYCDDLLILGIREDAAATIDSLKDIVTCSNYTDLSGGRFVGVQFDVSITSMFCHQHDYVASLVLPPDLAGSNRCVDKPLPVGSTHEDDISPLLSAAGVKVFRTLLGQVGYVASCTRPDVALAHSYLSRFLASPTERALRLFLQTVRYLRSHPSFEIHVRPSSDPTKLTTIKHGDSSFGNAVSPYPQTGWVVFINNSPLIWKSRRQSRVARSTTRAEVLALEEGIDATLHFTNCTAPFYSNIRVGIGCDGANVFKLSLLLSGASFSAERALLPIIREMQDKACVVPLQAATDLVEQHRIGIFKISTNSNLSDLLTKALDLGALTRLMSPSPSLSPVFGSEIVSSLPPLALRDGHRPTMEKERRRDGEEPTA